MQEIIYKRLRILFIIFILLVITSFILDVLYTAKHKIFIENVVLQQWAIIVTLLGIFGSLKFLRPKVILTELSFEKKGIKTYVIKYFVRLTALVCIYIFNLTNFTITGSKNFLFLAFITIFAMFLCSPNRRLVEIKSDIN